MKKIIIFILLTFNIGLFADLIDDGLAEFAKRNYEKSQQLFQESCDNGNTKGCLHLGAIHLMTRENKLPNYKLASQAFKKACDNGETIACKKYEHYKKY
jgi:TPR repeat protein